VAIRLADEIDGEPRRHAGPSRRPTDPAPAVRRDAGVDERAIARPPEELPLEACRALRPRRVEDIRYTVVSKP
jgi:hypothetical protein